MKKEDIVIVELNNRRSIEDLNSAATIEGLELNSIPKYVELIEKLGGKFKKKDGEKLNVYVTSGAQMNKSFRLKGSNAPGYSFGDVFGDVFTPKCQGLRRLFRRYICPDLVPPGGLR